MTATDLKSAIETYEKNVKWMLSHDATYSDVVNMLALIARLRDQLMFVQRGTYGVGSRGAR
jgi:hypothetical protein